MGRDFFPPVPPAESARPAVGDVVVAVLAVTLDVLAYLAPGEEGTGARVTVVGVLLICVSVVPLLFRRHHPVPVLGAVLAVQLAVNLGLVVDFGEAMSNSYGAAVAVALYTVARYSDRRAVALSVVAAAPVQIMRYVNNDQAFLGVGIVDVLVTPCLLVAIGLAVRQWKQQLDINRRLLADRAVTEERRRIARELHDIVAHHITTMYLMSGGARSTLDRDPETAREALVTLEESGRTALHEMRQLLGVLRSTETPEETPSEPQPGVNDIERLVADSVGAGLPTELHVTGRPRPLPMTVGLTLYRIVQEALTNARKHAGPARATVRLGYRPDRVTVEVTDDGAGGGDPGTSRTGGGYGLLGMRERIALHDGSLHVGNRAEGGFAVTAEVPLPADTYDMNSKDEKDEKDEKDGTPR
ncbi:sensor histidine kinase [Streptomyces sp. Je 1-369]|uniref:sensor histidine kinase n=1 Tax=Streptomyces sp. Je 1-369 TaxID=2966192 RepID=UPI00228592A9|nr:sensor histidine kinase [Streptomyces sp. Je 1-369]WAL98565.1 sensor histidine kinase [Streptomyces sp. Je 1-369]